MWPGMRPATGWMANWTSTPLRDEQVHQLAHRALRLRHRHAVARHDDHALAVGHQHRGVLRADLAQLLLALGAGRRRLAAGAEAGEQDVEERPVHRLAHELGEDRARGADQRAGNEQRVVAQHEAGRRHRDAGVAVEQRHHDRHVRAADRHHQLHAEDQRERRRRGGRAARSARPPPGRCRCRRAPGTGRRSRAASRGTSPAARRSTPCSLPQATIEPVRLTEPMTAPSSVAMMNASGSSSPGCELGVAQELDDGDERRRAAAGAVEDGDHLRHGGHRHALGAEPAGHGADRRRRATTIHQLASMPSVVKKVHATISAMPAAPSRLPRARRLRAGQELERQDEGDAGDQPDEVGQDLERIHLAAIPARAASNISSMRSVTVKPPTTLIVPRITASRARMIAIGAVGGGGDQHRADDDDAVDGVGAAHQRGVEHGRHLRDDLVADECRQARG